MTWATGTVAALLALGWLAWEVELPVEVAWRPAPLPGCAADRAEGLVLQQVDGDRIWASRGYAIYRSVAGGPFRRVASLIPPVGEPWGGFFRTLRARFGYQELLEVVPLGPELLLVFGGGGVFRLDLAAGRQERVQTLRYFGRGKGRGVMSRIAVDPGGDVYFGEYSTEEVAHTLRIYRGSDRGRSWSVVHEFAEGEALHVHGVEWDPVEQALWVMTGDLDHEVHLGRSRDQGRTFTWIGEGDQLYRACALIFTDDSVIWATDGEENQLVRWSRKDGRTEVVARLPAQSLYAQSLGRGRALVGQSTWDAAVYLLEAAGALTPLARFTPIARPGQPFPGVRLARGGPNPQGWLLFNPLRTEEAEAAIYRVRDSEAAACTPPPPRWTHRP